MSDGSVKLGALAWTSIDGVSWEAAYVAEIDVNYFGVAQRFGANQLALTLTNWGFGDIPLQTEASPDITDVTWTGRYDRLRTRTFVLSASTVDAIFAPPRLPSYNSRYVTHPVF